MRNFLDFNLKDIIYSLIPILICLTLHEFAHGFVAYKLGDNTAKERGRLTLNPIKHIDPIGFVSMMLLGFGWAKPVPVDMNNFKKPKQGMALTALAGPMTNFILAAFMMLLYGALYKPLYTSNAGDAVLQMIYTTAYVSISLGIFNLLPLPPLDGSKIFFSLLPDNMYYSLMRYERYGSFVLMILIVSGVLDSTLFTAISKVADVFFHIAEFAFDIVQKF